MKQHMEEELVAFMSVPERSVYEDSVKQVTELEAELVSDQIGLEQTEQRIVVLTKLLPTKEERDFDRTGASQEADKRLQKAKNYIATWNSMLQSHTEQLGAAREDIRVYLTRANIRLNEQLQQDTERKLMAKALVEAMLEAGLVKV